MIETRTQALAVETEFAARIDRIRLRVVLKLTEKIREIDATMSIMASDGDAAAAAVASAYRWFHDVSGIGPIVGFEATGQHARLCAAVLIDPFHARRGLSPEELTVLTTGFENFRIVALNETHFTKMNQR